MSPRLRRLFQAESRSSHIGPPAAPTYEEVARQGTQRCCAPTRPRGKPWAIEVDETATDFLLERGFSPHLGARPLKRAVEEHFLVPLAHSIVGAHVPGGEQFLFVTAPRGSIEVQFVGLEDKTDEELTETSSQEASAEEQDARANGDVRSLVTRTQFTRTPQLRLLEELEQVEIRVRNEVAELKQIALADMTSPDFWDDQRRFQTLAEAEYLDRLEAATRTASKLGRRLKKHLDQTPSFGAENPPDPADLCRLLAGRLYALQSALSGLDSGTSFECFVQLRLMGGSAESLNPGVEFVSKLVTMYLAWAERRGMQATVLRHSGGESVLFIGGLGAVFILLPEAGLHVFESIDDHEGRNGHSSERMSVAVQVAPCQPGDRSDQNTCLLQAEVAFARSEPPSHVVRRYRAHPSPLVRDAVRGYRTGRLDRVLAGKFDLFHA